MNSDSKSPRIPLKPHSSSSFSSSSSLAPLCSLCTAVIIKCCLRLLRITRLLLVSMRHLYKEQKGPSSWKQEVTHHSSWLCLFTQWQGLLHFSLVLLLFALYWRKWYKKTYIVYCWLYGAHYNVVKDFISTGELLCSSAKTVSVFQLFVIYPLLFACFSLDFQMSAVKFGEPGEVPSLLVVSNQRIYFLEMTSDLQ